MESGIYPEFKIPRFWKTVLIYTCVTIFSFYPLYCTWCLSPPRWLIWCLCSPSSRWLFSCSSRARLYCCPQILNTGLESCNLDMLMWRPGKGWMRLRLVEMIPAQRVSRLVMRNEVSGTESLLERFSSKSEVGFTFPWQQFMLFRSKFD